MSDDILSALEDILFIGFLKRVVVMNHIWDTVRVSAVGYNPDMALKNDDVATLPLLRLRKFGRQWNCRMRKINL